MMGQPDTQEHWAWDLYEKGLTLIPLGTAGEEPPAYLVQRKATYEEAKEDWPKTPRERWADWQKFDPSHTQIEGWLNKYPGCNWAIVTGKEINVVDADDEAAIEFVQNNLTRTPWMVRTGHGAHFYYQVSPSLILKNSQEQGAKLDTRGVGGYVVAPGSTHSSGRQYTLEIDPSWPVDSIKDLPVLTGEDLQKIASYQKGTDGPGMVIGEGTRLQFDARQFAPGAEEGVAQGSRDANLVKLIGKWVNEGLGLDTIISKALAVDENNTPPLGEGTVIQKVQSVVGTHARNNIEEIRGRAAPIESSGLLIPISQLQASPPKWILEGVIPDDSIGMLFGPSSGGKSFAAIDMGLNIAAGNDWHGRENMRPGGVVYVCGEGRQGVANRIRAWEKFNDFPVDNLPFQITRGPIRFLDDGDKAALLEAVSAASAALGGSPTLIIIDTLNRNFGDGDENSTKDMTKFIDAITDVHKETEASVLIVHHTNLTDGDRARGNGSLKNACDFEIKHAMRSKEGDPEKIFTLVGKKMKDGSEMAPVDFALRVVTLGEDHRGKEYTSCAIEISHGDSAEGAALAERILPPSGARQEITYRVLSDYKALILSNQPDRIEITVERSDLNNRLKNELKLAKSDPGKSTTCIKDALAKNWLEDVNGVLLRLTQDVV